MKLCLPIHPFLNLFLSEGRLEKMSHQFCLKLTAVLYCNKWKKVTARFIKKIFTLRYQQDGENRRKMTLFFFVEMYTLEFPDLLHEGRSFRGNQKAYIDFL